MSFEISRSETFGGSGGKEIVALPWSVLGVEALSSWLNGETEHWMLLPLEFSTKVDNAIVGTSLTALGVVGDSIRCG
jgi:hypothetical protein